RSERVESEAKRRLPRRSTANSWRGSWSEKKRMKDGVPSGCWPKEGIRLPRQTQQMTDHLSMKGKVCSQMPGLPECFKRKTLRWTRHRENFSNSTLAARSPLRI